MNFANVKSITIPEGDVKRVAIGGVTVWQKPNPLPYDAEVEWVSAPSGAYVDTGVILGPTMSVETAAVSQGNSPRQQRLFGCADSTLGNTALYINGSGYMAATIAGTGGYNDYEPTAGRRVTATLDLSDGNAEIVIIYPNGTVRTKNLSLGRLADAYSGTMPIFALRRPTYVDTTVECLFRLSSLRVYDGSTLVRDFVPVRVGTVGYLYDRANPTGGPSGNGLYGSATSTPLVAGPDVNGGAA